MPRFKTLRQRRINKLRESGFSYEEARILTGLRWIYTKKMQPMLRLNRVYIKVMMNARQEAVKKGLDYTPITTVKQAEKLIKDWYKRAVELRLYTPPSSKKSHKKMILDNKGNYVVDYEHARQLNAKSRAKNKLKKQQTSLEKSVWIEELRDRIKDPTLSDAKREQFRQHLLNLGGKP